MPAQIIALLAAIAYALGFIFSKRGLRFSTPTTITFVSLLVQTVILFGIVFVYTGIPHTSALVFSLFVVAGILQAIVRQLTYIGIEKIGAARSGPIRASVPLWSAAIAILFLGEKMTATIAIGTLLVVGGILLISWRADEAVTFDPGTSSRHCSPPCSVASSTRCAVMLCDFPMSRFILAPS
jgi:drug/metabolite transporter, DME family